MRSSAAAGGILIWLSGRRVASRRYSSSRWIARRARVAAFTAALPAMWSPCPWVLRISTRRRPCSFAASSAVFSPIEGSMRIASLRSSTMRYMPLSYGGTRHARMRTMEQVSCPLVREIPIENTAPAIGVTQGRPAVLGKRWMVSSSHYLASQAGASVFQRGGNAIDAGVAAGIALNVLERHLTDFGGVAPIVLFQPGMAAPETIDGLGRWPSGLALDAYRQKHGDDMPIGVARSVTPAACDAWLTAVARHGRLTLAEVLAPNIELAEGVPVVPRLARAIAMLEERIRQWPSSTKVFLPGGRAPRVGEILVQSDLAALFRTLVSIEKANASKGRAAAIMTARDAIYTGEISRAIVESQKRNGGAITADDLASYHVKLEPPAHTTYRGIDVYACGPWSQGPLVPMTLNLLEGYDVATLGPGSLEFLHRYVEAFKLAAADREGFFGDPEQVDVPIGGLLQKEYAEERQGLIDDGRAYPELPPPGDPWRFEGRAGHAG